MLSKLRDLLKPKNPSSGPQAASSPMPATAGSWDELFQQAQGLQQQGQLERGIEAYDKCVALAPERAEAYYKRANALNTLGRLEPALADYDRAIGLDPAYTYAYCNRGSVLERLGRRDEALASYDRALELDPKDALTHYNRGTVLKDLERYEDALASYDAAIALNATHAEAHVNRGNVLQELKRHEAAIESFERALALNPTIAAAFRGLGSSLQGLMRMEEALAACDKAIALKADAASYVSRGNVLLGLDRHAEAAASYLKAIELDPECTQAYFQHGYLQRIANRFERAAADYKVVARLEPDYAYLAGNLIEASLQTCDWTDFDVVVERITAGIENDKKVSHPFISMALTDSARLQHLSARAWASNACPPDDSLGPIARRPRPQKLTVAYFSPDFHEHPIGRLLAELIEIHDRARFEVIAFSFGAKLRDEPQQRLMHAFDRFIEVREKSSVEIAELARSLDVDIAVDLCGYTLNNRADVFALRVAPVQVGYLGYLGTMGASYMDYIVADRTVVTPQSESHYSEKIIYLPDTHQVNDRQRQIADRVFTRAELGLPEQGFVFCCFNLNYKISPTTFAGWMRILKAVPGSVLFLFANHEAAKVNLRAHAVRYGVDADRLVFGGRLSPAEYLARYRTADLFLDTLPYNAGTTASDALWAGLPVLTLTGEAFASRIAASLLTALGVPELITSTQQQYEQLAIELASNPQRLAALRTRIQDNRLTSALFDTARFARNLEAAFTAIHARYQAGESPEHISLNESWDELFKQAQGLQQHGQLEQAVEMYGKCVELTPERAEAYYKRANALNGLERLEPALADYDRAIARNPAYTYAFCNRGSVLERLGRGDEALASYDRALELDPKDALTHYNRGSVLKDLERYEEALSSYEAAIGLNANYAEAHVNRGSVLQELRRYEAAIESFDRALALNPQLAHAAQGRGICLHCLNRLEPALAAYNKAIALKPDLAAAYLGRGALLAGLDRHAEATNDYLKAIAVEPGPKAFQALAECQAKSKRLDLAIASLDAALELDPDGGNYLLGDSRSARMQACLWDGLDADLERIATGVRERKPVCHPFTLAALIDSPALLRAAAEILVRDRLDPACKEDLGQIAALAPIPSSRPRSDKIRIGYFSSDLRTHPVALLTAGLFECHDRKKFEVTAFAFGPECSDPIVARLAKAFDRFIDVRQKSNLEVVTLARELGIDIAMDLNGFTAHCRAEIFVLRAAPIQINFLGYPGTMGAGFMDYLLADGVVIPREQQRHYAEKIAYLPNSFIPFDASYAIADRKFTRAELGLPANEFVFCCFNNSYKILPEVFDHWMRILGRTGNSVLWLQQANETVAANLRKEAERRGIDGRRLIFASRVASLAEHLARIRAADLVLDTFPYNAHATALDTLWAGVPLLTYPGETFASRVAASMLRTLGLPELIADSPSQYEEKAVELAAGPARLAQLRHQLAQRNTPLFDTKHYTGNLEAVYEAIYERHRSGSPPAHINEHFAT